MLIIDEIKVQSINFNIPLQRTSLIAWILWSHRFILIPMINFWKWVFRIFKRSIWLSTWYYIIYTRPFLLLHCYIILNIELILYVLKASINIFRLIIDQAIFIISCINIRAIFVPIIRLIYWSLDIWGIIIGFCVWF